MAWELEAFTIFVKDEKTTEESHSCEIGNTVGNRIECSCYNPMHPTFNNYLVSAVKYLHLRTVFLLDAFNLNVRKISIDAFVSCKNMIFYSRQW